MPERVPISYPSTRQVRNSAPSHFAPPSIAATSAGSTATPACPLVRTCPSCASSASIVDAPANAAPARLARRPSNTRRASASRLAICVGLAQSGGDASFAPCSASPRTPLSFAGEARRAFVEERLHRLAVIARLMARTLHRRRELEQTVEARLLRLADQPLRHPHRHGRVRGDALRELARFDQ